MIEYIERTMEPNIQHSGKKRRLLVIGVASVVILIILVVVLRSCTKSEPTAEEVRMQHLDWMVKLVENYKQRFGSYPQPTARTEAAEGIKHAWGYRSETPSLASCTVAVDDAGAIVPAQSVCGGGVYDIDGNLIGWKGVLTAESGLNSIEIAERGSGRVESPISEIVKSVPMDPAFSDPAHISIGLGEYVYAVRNPDAPGSDSRDEYQIASVMVDPMTGEKSAVIRGNYFVKSDEKDVMPASLIGPGLLFDEFNNPVEDQSRPLHSLIDGQKYGFPNPVLGEGEDVMQLLTLTRRAKRLLSEIEERLVFITALPVSPTASVSSLESNREKVRQIITSLESSSDQSDLSVFENDLGGAADTLSGAMNSFALEYASKVEDVLVQEVENYDQVKKLLSDVFEISTNAENSILVARDDILNYVDGEGIEEQTRQRVGRKLDSVLEDLPDLDQLFVNADLAPMRVFLTEGEQSSLSEVESDEETSGSVMLTTISSELHVHLEEFKQIVDTILEDLITGGAELEDVDSSLTKLMQALTSEHERIKSLFDELEDSGTAVEILEAFRLAKDEDPFDAVRNAAEQSRMDGDLSQLIFDSSVLANVSLERAPGIPDVGIVEDELMAEYKGIPYPLP